MIWTRKKRLVVLSIAVMFLPSCASFIRMQPKKSATEQFMISKAAIRSLSEIDLDFLINKKVFIEDKYLESYNKAFIVGELRDFVSSKKKGLLTDNKELADVIVEIRSAALSIDASEWLIGLPSITIPAPMVGQFKTPELPIIKNVKQRGISKISVLAYENGTGRHLYSSGILDGKTKYDSWWFLLFGPLTFSDLYTQE